MKQHERFVIDRVSRYIEFEVSQDSEWLSFHFDWDIATTWEEMRIFDPAGRLRYIHWDVENAREGLLHCKPEQTSYMGVPGDIPAGTWRIEFQQGKPSWLDWHWSYGQGELPDNIALPPADRELWSDGQTAADGRNFVLNLYDWDQCREVGERWYNGDFHTHTILSDGQMTPEQAMTMAESLNFDFYVVTDHNALPSSWPRSRVLAIPGTEMTSHYRGDWNAIGLKETLDFRDTVYHQSDEGADEGYPERQRVLRQRAAELGAIRSLNHPMTNSRHGWGDMETLLEDLDALEIWHCPSMPREQQDQATLLLWTVLWNDGYRITGLGGSDYHYLPGRPFKGAEEWQAPGDPRTYVWADRLSPNAILSGVRQRRVYISRGPELQVHYSCGDRQFQVGDDLTEAVRQSAGIVQGTLKVDGMEDGYIALIVNGEEAARHEVHAGADDFTFVLDWHNCDYAWSRIECRSTDGRLLAITNPVFVGSKEPQLFTWDQLLDQADSIAPGTRKLLETVPEFAKVEE